MTYVYILQSTAFPERFYVGVTHELKSRLTSHNAGEVRHTAKFRPWTVKNYFPFQDAEKARAFEKYLKSGFGRFCTAAFLTKDTLFAPSFGG